MIDLDSQSWPRALQAGLGADVAALPGRRGGWMACFRAGPFRVAYPDFLIGSDALDDGAMQQWPEVARRLKADLMRIQAPQEVADARVFARHRLGSVAIAGIDQWSERQWEKARRAANRQARSLLHIRAGRAEDGAHLHRLYLSTLYRHGGAARYSREYFEAIAAEAAIVAVLDGSICGFVCSGIRGARACYMHGAHLPEARAHYPSDQLFLAMLRAARSAGAEYFDFLPSPASQGSLASYKRAWGGGDVPSIVSDLALNPVRARGFALALRVANGLGALRLRRA